MAIAATVKRFLDNHGITYHVSNHARTATLEEAAAALAIEPRQVARAVLLKDAKGYVMAVLPVTYRLDFNRLQKIMQRHLDVVSGKEANKLFVDCEPGSRPPLGECYSIDCVLDTSLIHADDIYFEPGAHNAIVHVANRDFQDLLVNAHRGAFATPWQTSAVALEGVHPPEAVAKTKRCIAKDFAQLERCVLGATELPIVPLALELMSYIGAEDALPDATILRQINAHPELCQIILNHCNHVILQEQQYTTIQQVSSGDYPDRLLLGIASALLVLQSIQVDISGPFSAQQIWRHALFSATVSYWLCQECPIELNLDPEAAFCGALYQNIGILLLGYLFKPEYQLMNRLAYAHPRCSLERVERKVLGMGQARDVVALGHERLGAWLLQKWDLPEYIVHVALEHHNSTISGPHANLIRVVQLSNQLLDQQGFNDSIENTSSERLRTELDISLESMRRIFDKLTQTRFVMERITQDLRQDFIAACS